MKLRRNLAMLGVALLPIVAFTPAASAGGGHGQGWKQVHVTFTPTGVVDTPVDAVCDVNNPTVCVYMSKAPNVTQTGDLQGTTVQAATVALMPTGQLLLNATGTFVGTVKGCGAGSFLYSGRGIFDASGGVIRYPIAAGSGTGELEGITGTVTDHLTGQLEGVLRCRKH